MLVDREDEIDICIIQHRYFLVSHSRGLGFILELEDFTLLLNTGVLGASHHSARNASDMDPAMVYRMQTFESVSFNISPYRPQGKQGVLFILD